MNPDQARHLFQALEACHPAPETELRHEGPFQLLVATLLSAQCTDERVNQVTPALFRRCPDARALAGIETGELEELIRSTGFFHQKARALKECARALEEGFAGRVPETTDELTRLPGVGRKTANLVLGACFGRPGVVVDTHVKRTAGRLGLTSQRDPEKIERDLQAWLEPEEWYPASTRLLLHGRRVCLARAPRCPECPLREWCDTARGG